MEKNLIICTGPRYDTDVLLKDLDTACFRCKNFQQSAFGASTADGVFLMGSCKKELRARDNLVEWHCVGFKRDMEHCQITYLECE